MRLKRLIIHGFKSFKDKTVIHFDDGITGIVGPNGCGKSNIVDALFWVMGEQSAKHLRGNTMKDVIFAGSEKYSPGTWAEVSLVLENSEGKHIHIGNKVVSPSEIQLTRKLYRNSETEYRVNGIPCRLKDIQEVFMDTGAGAKSYSIIAQGEINRLVQAKPQERRVMIEEVAGITKYKIRKRDSLKKIEQANTNLARLNDLQIEIEKNLKNLKSQAEKAERAKNLREKVRRNDLVTSSHKVFDALKVLKEGNESITQMAGEIEKWSHDKGIIEISLEQERIIKEESIEKIDDLSMSRNEISNKLAAAEERFSGLCSKLSEKEKLISSRQAELEDLKLEIAERVKKQDDINHNREKLEEQNNEDFDFSELEEKVENLKEELDLKEEQLLDLNEDLSAKKEKLSTIQRENFQNNSKLEEYATQLQDMTLEIEELEDQFSSVSTKMADERDAVAAKNEVANKLKLELEAIKQKSDELQLLEHDQQEDFQTKNREFIKVESTLSSLQELHHSLEGVKQGTQEYLAQNENDDSIDILSHLIQCDEKFTSAVQASMSSVMDLVICCDKDVENKFVSWSNQNIKKAADIFIKNSGDSNDNQLAADMAAIEKALDQKLYALNDIVKVPLRFEDGVAPLLTGHYVLEQFNEKKLQELLKNYSSIRSIIALDGSKKIEVYNSGIIYSVVGENGAATGAIARNNKIKNLRAELENLTSSVTKSKQSLEELKQQIQEVKNTEEELRLNESNVRAEFISLDTALKTKLEHFEVGNSRLVILKNRGEEISKKRLHLLEQEEKMAKDQALLEEALSESDEIIDEIKEDVVNRRDQYSGQKEFLMQKQLEANSFQEKLQQYIEQAQDVADQIEKQNKRIESYTEQITKFDSDINEIEVEIEEIETSNQDLAEVVSLKDEDLINLKDQLSNLLHAMQERENEVKELTSGLAKNEKEVSTLEVKINQAQIEEEQVVRNTFEKYQVNLRICVGKFLEFSSDELLKLNNIDNLFNIETDDGPKEVLSVEYEFHRRYGQDLKDCAFKFKQYRTELSRLGDINWQAVEDYNRQKIRFDFLNEQEIELKKSLEDLEQAILHIDEKSKERFKKAFYEVSTRFEKVFPIIFGGGSAHLNVTGDLNDTDCGVDIVAQPPGKKMQNINLMSGGEKALTAVSLIFSIFLVKPSPFCLLDEVDAPLDDANVGRFNELLREMSSESQFILITHNKKTMELNDTLYGITMQNPGISTAVSVQLH